MRSFDSLLHDPPKPLQPDTLYYVGWVTVVALIDMLSMTIRVGMARSRYKVDPPNTEGDPRFVLIHRAHQNCLENFPLFITAMWAAAIFFDQLPAAILGGCYVISREIYFLGYSSKADRRLPGFALSMLSVTGLVIVAVIGCGVASYQANRGPYNATYALSP